MLLAPQSAGLPLRLRESSWELRASEPSLFIVPSAILPQPQSWRVTADLTVVPPLTDKSLLRAVREKVAQLNLGCLKQKTL